MSAFVIRRRSSAPTDAIFAVLSDFASHGSFVPHTTMRTDPGPKAEGWTFSGETRFGPLRLSDPMVLTRWEPPTSPGGSGGFAMRKTGRVLAGWADVVVEPVAGGGSAIRWTEQIDLRPRALGRLISPMSRWAGAAMFGRALDGMVERAERRDRG